MDTKIIVICILTLILSVLVLVKRSEFLTVSAILTSDSLSSVTPFSNTNAATFSYFSYVESLLKELSKNPVYTPMNQFLSAAGPTGTEYTPYASDAQIEQILDTAYTQGETGLAEKDRVLLRQIAYFASFVTETLTKDIGGDDLPFTSDGVPVGTPDIISESGKSTREFLFNAILGSKESINNILPAKFPRYGDSDDINQDTNAERGIWVRRATIIPHAYIAWLAKNKWNLSTTWKSQYCSSGTPPTPTRIVSRPSGASYGPGTYTLAQLGNPTSLDIYAPVQYKITRSSGGSNSGTISKRVGCIYSPDKTISDVQNVTSVEISVPT